MATNASPTQARAARVKEAVAGAKAQPPQPGFTEPDQVKRFAGAKEAGDVRVLDIDQVYDPSWMEGARVLITGANRGIGLGLAQEAARNGATVIGVCRKPSAELEGIDRVEVVETGKKKSNSVDERLQRQESHGVSPHCSFEGV